jgi:cytochrome c-type biogenesis protein CcmE
LGQKAVLSRKQTKTIISVVVIGSAVLYLLYLSAKSSFVYYYSVDKFLQSPAVETSKQAVRLAGRVKPGSIKRNAEKMQLEFELAGKTRAITVEYTGGVPDNFEDGREVLVEGNINENGIFTAEKIMTQCESKYKAKLKD